MPFKSQAQARFLWAKKPALAKEFSAATPSIKALPNHVQDFSRNKKMLLAHKKSSKPKL